MSSQANGPVNYPHAVPLPPHLLAALASRPSPEHGATAAAGPLTPAERETLEQALQWWTLMHEAAEEQIQAITLRLAGAPRYR